MNRIFIDMSQALLAGAVALKRISDTVRLLAARVGDLPTRAALLEVDAHCKDAIRMMAEARQEALPCSADCADGKHAKDCPYDNAKKAAAGLGFL